jgi:hypothetical protein
MLLAYARIAAVIFLSFFHWSTTMAKSHDGPVPTLPNVQCLVVDSDANIDDMRALAMLGQYYRIAAVITTAGMQSPSAGAATLTRFLDSAKIPATVIQGHTRGANTSTQPDWGWLEHSRADMARIDAALSQMSPSKPRFLTPINELELSRIVSNAVEDCAGIGMLVLGPWSSFAAYRTFVDKNKEPAKFIVSQGRSIEDPDKPDWDRVNCHFDLAACQMNIRSLGKDAITWIDLPGPGIPFPVDQEIISKIGETSASRALKEVMDRASIMEPQEQWDDMPAMFLLRPDAFKREGQHIIPARSAKEMQAVEAQLLNGQRDGR